TLPPPTPTLFPYTTLFRSSNLPRGAEDATRKRPGMPAMVQHHLAADDDVVHAVGGLHPPGHTRGPIVRHLVLLHPDAREVEDHQIGRAHVWNSSHVAISYA